MLILLIAVLVILFGGGGGYYYRRGTLIRYTFGRGTQLSRRFVT